jgi:TolB-like protein
MKPDTVNASEAMLSRDAIDQQLERVFLYPLFMNSDILRKFLLFIVDQTLTGHSDWLKEYTIGVNVLCKPANFKPQDNGIVRIHAGRLRRALHHYYNTMGTADPIKIFIPKGRYIPVFIDNSNQIINSELSNSDKPLTDKPQEILVKKQEAIAIIPFQHFHNDALENSLVDGLGLQLSTALMQFDKYSVVAYCTIRDLWKRTNDISKVGLLADAKYVVTGSIQTLENTARAHVQIIDLYSNRQVLSCMYEGEFSSQNIFKLQDEIVQFIISEITRSRKMVIDDKSRRRALVAVA